jgi:dTDP-glucose 4,6-dehydratase
MNKKSILVTGGAGFIGSAFVRLLSSDPSYKIIVVDKLTYAGKLSRLSELKVKPIFYQADICDREKIQDIFHREKPYLVAHFAAESHVDRSIKDASPFIDTNIKGTQILLDASRKNKVQRFIHISTDEVYGEIITGKFTEDSPIRANSPYAASKAAADLLVQSYIRTYGFPGIIIRPSNNYGPWQYPEKLIPLSIQKIIEGKKVSIYGDGCQIREWLYVDDCVRGIKEIMERGKLGEVYNLGSSQESTNICTIDMLLKAMGVSRDRVEFVKDRPGHDVRYSLDSDKVTWELDWQALTNLPDGIKLTVDWYLNHKDWQT